MPFDAVAMAEALKPPEVVLKTDSGERKTYRGRLLGEDEMLDLEELILNNATKALKGKAAGKAQREVLEKMGFEVEAIELMMKLSTGVFRAMMRDFFATLRRSPEPTQEAKTGQTPT